VAQGFSARGAARANVLLQNFVVGFCIEEQNVLQAKAAGDPRYDLQNRDEWVDRDAFPLMAEAGREIFEDDDRRFTELVELILGACEGLLEGPSGTP
jgi:TetR/AcrR family tetracycline transcriptional repressor